jgi:hypothetical protein
VEEKIKACYIAFLSTNKISSSKEASDKLKRLASSAYLARDLSAFHRITVDAPILDEYAISDAEDVIRRYDFKYSIMFAELKEIREGR